MRRSQFLINTLKETPKEAVVTSHILMLRACMIKPLASGIYTLMPLALRSIRKIERIVREELDAAGCQELLMPVVQPADLWEESGRWQDYGKELLRFTDRKDNGFCLGPTHEEVVTDMVRREVRSYKELPLNFYQIQTKFRDEIRPRFGLMRGREFIMKDAYSFDAGEEECDRSYWLMYEAYKRIFTRCGLDFRPVEADSGAIGGSYTHEFHVLAQSGEDLILSCDSCDYAANVERCEIDVPETDRGSEAELIEVATPAKKTIEEVADFLGESPERFIKTLLFKADDRWVGALIPGHRELNETALKNACNAVELSLVNDAELLAEQGFCAGFLGPRGWPKEIALYVDPLIMAGSGWIAGANKVDTHLRNLAPQRDIRPSGVLALSQARVGDRCPRCRKGSFAAFRGIEVGQVFKLGIKYSQSMKAVFLDAEGLERPFVMGCYGIGITRTMAAALEQNHDKNGIIWPLAIAPFHVALLNLDPRDEQVNQAVASIYADLRERRVEVLLDDSSQRPGSKFKDADLIGLPVQITVGARSLGKGLVEWKDRRSGEKYTAPLAEIIPVVVEALKKMGWEPS